MNTRERGVKCKPLGAVIITSGPCLKHVHVSSGSRATKHKHRFVLIYLYHTLTSTIKYPPYTNLRGRQHRKDIDVIQLCLI